MQGAMQGYVIVDAISCGYCGYYDNADKFRKASEGELKEFSSIYAGAVCPECGNLSELDFEPDFEAYDKIPQK